ncbi:MAG: methionine--tRNA ligase [Deltaproteobacteria bacterium]|nr:MAG: methionine--tRNA ligase [Deltaproteobacteria bacterium]
MPKRVLVTSALPYANGSIHLGHLLEFVQTDVYVRARKLAGEDVIFMWADDAHGTPIQVRAQKEGISPEELVARAYEEHVRDFRDFQIGYDVFHTTHAPEVRRHVEAIFRAMEARGDIETRTVEQLYCDRDAMFLPDRFVRGTCPKCGAADQYGDACEVCGSTYAPTDLRDPHCAVCGSQPRLATSEHVFVKLGNYEDFLRKALAPPNAGGVIDLQPAVRNYVQGWIEGGLRDWDISRDPPYFGFEIPGHPGKYFYVWFDAPVGYIGATEKWCREHGRDFDAYWHDTTGETEIVHVIGKDIVYFHCLFWPAMLHAGGYILPRRIQVHGWLTVDGEKMSKSRGTFILARTYLDHLPASALRYYFAAKTTGSQDDFDLNLEDFVLRVNADLVKKAANLASRSIKFVHGRLGGEVAALPEDAADLVAAARRRLSEVPDFYRAFDSARAVRCAMEIAEDFNLYLTRKEPWKVVRDDPEAARAVCSAGVYATQVVAAILAPVLPDWAEKVRRMLHWDGQLDFATAAEPLPAGHAVGPYEVLAEPISAKAVEAIVEASKESLGGTGDGGAAAEEAARAEAAAAEPLAPEIRIDDFAKVDLRVAQVTAAEAVEGAKKLLRLTLDVGPLGTRTVLSGIAKSYEPASLVGKKVVLVANLAPRTMKFGTSEGMILAAGDDPAELAVVFADERARPGDRVT